MHLFRSLQVMSPLMAHQLACTLAFALGRLLSTISSTLPGAKVAKQDTSRQHNHRRHPLVAGKSTHLPANARFLERSQGAQRRLLRLGETPDVRNIESLVGSIPPQRLQRLATVQVPEQDGPVIPATGQPAAIR